MQIWVFSLVVVVSSADGGFVITLIKGKYAHIFNNKSVAIIDVNDCASIAFCTGLFRAG